MTQPDDFDAFLAQAASVLRTQPEPGWDAIAERVIAAVRATPQRGGWPLRAQNPPGHTTSGQLYVSDQVVRSTLVAALRQRYQCIPTGIEFDVEDHAIRAVHIEVTGRYGTYLVELADHVRDTTITTITELLGPAAQRRGPIDVTITDVVTGDPRRT